MKWFLQVLVLCTSFAFCQFTPVFEIVAEGMSYPVALAALPLPVNGSMSFFVVEKNSGRVLYCEGSTCRTVLDLSVYNASNSGLLGVAVDKQFISYPYVYLFYTYSTSYSDSSFYPDYGGIRIVRYRWDGSQLVTPLVLWEDPMRARDGSTHVGGALSFGPDGYLYAVIGYTSRGWWDSPATEQNTLNNSLPPVFSKRGVIVRLTRDGGIPEDNPFVQIPNASEYFAYGVRNSIGMTHDPLSGNLWMTENSENLYDEVNLVRSGFNGGWLKIAGPDDRDATYYSNNYTAYNRDQLYYLPNAQYYDPVFSWKRTIAPMSICFVTSPRYGLGVNKVLITDFNLNALHMFTLAEGRDSFVLEDDLQDRVADTSNETQQHIVYRGLVLTSLVQGIDGYLYATDFFNGKVFRLIPEVAATHSILGGWIDVPNPLARQLAIKTCVNHDPTNRVLALDAYGRFATPFTAEELCEVGFLSLKLRNFLSVRVPLTTLGTSRGDTFFVQVSSENLLWGDLNDDECINDEDLLHLINHFGEALSDDIDGDGVVSDAELISLLLNFGYCNR